MILAAFLYWIDRRKYYFKNLGIPYVPSTLLLGSFGDAFLGKTGFYDYIVKLCNRPEVKDKPFFGIFLFHKPGLMITDPDLIKQITVKDFNSFSNRYSSSDSHDPMYYSLFAVKGAMWKHLRGKLSPFFSSGKLKTMHYLIDQIGSNMVNFIQKRLDKDNKVELETKELASLYTTDVIASCAFGVEANSLENPDAEFRVAGRKIFKMTFRRGIEFLAFFMLPQVMKLFRLKLFPASVSQFMENTISHVMEVREKSCKKRNDLIDTLVELKNSDDKEHKLTMDMLIAQAATFFSAGFETSSTTLSFALYEIVKNEDVQVKLRSEIRDMLIRTEGKVLYDAVKSTMEMPYLHQVIEETLRIYAIIPILDRECSNPNGYSMEPFNSFRIPYGMPIYIPIYAIQRDEKNFHEPLKFDPDRFSSENIGNIKPFTHIPFGSGPRNCIGERFGLMQVKVGLVKILKEFYLETTVNTPKEIILEKKAMLIQADKGLFLSLVKDPLY